MGEDIYIRLASEKSLAVNKGHTISKGDKEDP